LVVIAAHETEMSTARSTVGQVCSTIVDEILQAQLAGGGQVCSTVVDEILQAQMSVTA
jgi:hypothetical protein